VDEARWFPIEEAIKRASYENEKGILIKAREEWDKLASKPS